MNSSHQTLYREVSKSDRKRTAIYISLAVFVITVTGIVIASKALPFGIVIWLLFIVGGCLALLVRWHSQTTVYRCPQCNHEFEISAWIDFISPHLPEKKYLKCPSCGKRKWAIILMKQ